MLVTFAEGGQNVLRPGLLTGDAVADLSPRYWTIASFLAEHPTGWDPEMDAPAGFPTHPRANLRVGPPIDPGGLVYAVGANYRQHAEEAGLSVPSQPIIFNKTYTALVGPGEPIVIPPVSNQLDYEGEMAVVIGRDATRVSRDEAKTCVAGVTILNDTTARDLQWVELGKNRIVDWFASKNLDRSSPLGPGIASIRAVPDLHRLRLQTTLNGKIMQDADTSLMVYDTFTLIEFITARATLRAGDVVATGTPFGVGGFREIFLKQGDTVRIELEHVGVLENGVYGG
ncbi:MAG: 5-carboxymethyl-2-hydroxymuconate delta-isomerase [Rhodospirillales bacterium]|nr:5-carboxymethyl-2-hydroxymuconate delta-isomerase [Rhodospirillales bacterium]